MPCYSRCSEIPFHRHTLPTSVLNHQTTSRITPPVASAHQEIYQTFCSTAMPWSAAHRGIDIRASTAEVIAPAAGEVTFIGQVVDRGVVTIRHPNGLLSSFEPVESDLEVGAVVAPGDPIGMITADASHCEVLCVHWGVRVPDG